MLSASADETFRDLHNSSYRTKAKSIKLLVLISNISKLKTCLPLHYMLIIVVCV